MADTVQRLRLHAAAGSDAVPRRHRAEALLAGGLAAPRGLPAGALLCVRRVAMALPAGSTAALALQAGARLRGPLDAAWAQAVRPAAGSPGAAVPALWFADAAELLVFLARRAAAGDTAAWWWSALAGHGQPAWGAVAAAWLREAQAVPAALAMLEREAGAVAAALGEAACERLAVAVASSFGVVAWQGSAVAGRGRGAGESGPVSDDVLGTADRDAMTSAGAVASRAREADARPEDVPRIAVPAPDAAPLPHSSAAQRLLALARALHETPWAASSPGFAARVVRAADVAVTSMHPAAARPAVAAAPAVAATMSPAAPSLTPRAHRPGRARSAIDAAPRHRLTAASDAAASPERHAASMPMPVPTLQRCTTSDAGLFFLLPLLLRRGCYGDFTQPAQPGLSLHPAWLLLALCRRHGRCERGDALPDLLRGWAGAPRVPRQPAAWRHTFDELRRNLAADAAALLRRPSRGALAWLVRRPGLVLCSATRIDVHFDLATHPLAIRAAGLDRDPGWIPAAGRHVAFHFELGAARP